jgi:hypothetical protein
MESEEGANIGCRGFHHFRYVRAPSAKSYICFEHTKYMDPTELWIKEQERFLSADKNYQREPVEYINIYFCFVDLSDSIVKVDVEKYLFSSSDPDTRIIGESILLQKVEKLRQYKFQEMMLFHVGLESTDMHNYARSKTNEYNFVETFPVIRDIYVPPSIFIFQPVNYLLVLMKERPPIRSSIKVSAGSKKKVRFSEEVHNKTRRKGTT